VTLWTRSGRNFAFIIRKEYFKVAIMFSRVYAMLCLWHTKKPSVKVFLTSMDLETRKARSGVAIIEDSRFWTNETNRTWVRTITYMVVQN